MIWMPKIILRDQTGHVQRSQVKKQIMGICQISKTLLFVQSLRLGCDNGTEKKELHDDSVDEE
jgi:hypothetical protein